MIRDDIVAVGISLEDFGIESACSGLAFTSSASPKEIEERDPKP